MMESVGSNNLHQSKTSSFSSQDFNKFKSNLKFPEDVPPKLVSNYDSRSPLTRE